MSDFINFYFGSLKKEVFWNSNLVYFLIIDKMPYLFLLFEMIFAIRLFCDYYQEASSILRCFMELETYAFRRLLQSTLKSRFGVFGVGC